MLRFRKWYFAKGFESYTKDMGIVYFTELEFEKILNNPNYVYDERGNLHLIPAEDTYRDEDLKHFIGFQQLR